MEPQALTAALKLEAARLGFNLSGACPAGEAPDYEQYGRWLAEGYGADMAYLQRHAEARRHPRSILPSVRSLLVLAINYRTAARVEPKPGEGSVSCYAWGVDYHRVVREKLHRLADLHRELIPAGEVRGVVDSAPILERQFARQAGLGWLGKNSLLLNRRFGSWVFLAVLATSEVLAYDEPFRADHCGTCRACLDACPTQAFVAPGVLDSRRCISYATIEAHGLVDRGVSAGVGNWVFGCDVCQDVCPWNRKAAATTEPSFQPAEGMNPVELRTLEAMTEDSFKARFADSPLARPKYSGIQRNLQRVRENQANAATRGPNDPEP